MMSMTPVGPLMPIWAERSGIGTGVSRRSAHGATRTMVLGGTSPARSARAGTTAGRTVELTGHTTVDGAVRPSTRPERSL